MNEIVQSTSAGLSGAEKPKILIIDDDTSSIEVIFEALGNDYEILCATQGEHGIDIAGNVLPDIILLDIVMDGIDGYEVCASLKANPRTANIPVIFVTGLGASAQEVKGFEVGAIDYVTKPINAPIVRARVRAQMQMSQKLSELSVMQKTSVDGAQSKFTPLEEDIMKWLQLGKSDLEIASLIGISASDVKSHVSGILVKLGPEALSDRYAYLLTCIAPQLRMPLIRAAATLTGVTDKIEYDSLPVALTNRQKEVLHWMCVGKTNWEISQILGTVEDTIKYHVSQIFARLNVVSRAQAVAKVLSMKKQEL